MFYGAVGRVGIRGLFGGFSPASLFAAGEQGVWYDPSDFSTMFENSAGTTPVTAVEQPVGLILDKSKGLALGAEQRANGVTGLVGTATAASYNTLTGIGSVNRVAFPSDQSFVQFSGLTANALYRVEFSAVSVLGVTVRSGDQAAAGVTFTAAILLGYVRANAGGLITITSGANGTATFTLVSMRELPGNHASQSTSASRPVLSARVNQLLATDTLSTQSVTTLAATYTLSFSGAGVVTATGTNIGVYTAGSNSLVCTAGTLTLTVVGSVTFADLRVTNDGVGLPAYQRVTTSTDYDTTGFPLYLRFDGTDDGLVTANINFSTTNKTSAFAGIRKLSDASRGMVVELGAALSTAIWNISTARTVNDINFSLNGTLSVNRSATPYTSPITNTLSCVFDIAGSSVATEIIPRINAVTPTLVSSGIEAGTGNFSNNPLYIGRRSGTTFPYNGRIYSLIVLGRTATAAEISNTETWVNGKTMAY